MTGISKKPCHLKPLRRVGPWRLALLQLVAALALQSVGLPTTAQAQQYIGPGREAEVLALLAPHRDGAEVVPGVVLQQVRIEAQRVVLEVGDARGGRAQLELVAQAGPTAFALQRADVAAGPLKDAIDKLAAAVTRSDDGRFFAAADSADQRPRGPAAAARPNPGGTPIERGAAPVELAGPQAVASALAWLVLVLAMLAKAWRPPRTWITFVVGALVLAAAAALRRSMPLTPLHADDHAFRELGVALALPELDGRAAALLADYGPAWWQLQRWTVPLFGDHHDAVGRWAAAVGALAVALAAVTARRVSGRWLAGLVGALVMAAAPAAARVAHSESTLVVAQLLVAAALWLASPPSPPRAGRWDLVGVVAALLLLAWGHPLGPMLAVGAGLCAWALSLKPGAAGLAAGGAAGTAAAEAVAELVPDGFGAAGDDVRVEFLHPSLVARGPRALPSPALQPADDGPSEPKPLELEDVLQGSPSTASAGSGVSASAASVAGGVWRWLPGGWNLLALAVGALAVGLAAAWHWSLRPELLGNRLSVQENALPFPSVFWSFELWWDRAWVATAFTTSVAALGLGGLWAQRRVHGRALAAWTLLAWLAGCGALGAAGLVVVACVTDAARYQAPMMAVWLISGAFAMRFADLLPPSQLLIGKGVAAVALLAAVVQVLLGSAATHSLDAQGQAYQVLRRELGDERGVLWLVAPERGSEKRHVVADFPVGKWSEEGPESKVVTLAEYQKLCRNGTPPQPAYVFLGPACQAVDLPDVSTPCAGLEALIDPAVPVRGGFIKPMVDFDPRGLRGEFHTYARDPLDWRLGKARCPGHR